jgi:hypothetical protein
LILQGSDAEVCERILVDVPIGTSLKDAERIIVNYGLRCSVESDSATGKPYLSCGYTDDSDFWVSWVWQIRIDCDDDKVSNVSCKQAGIGP